MKKANDFSVFIALLVAALVVTGLIGWLEEHAHPPVPGVAWAGDL